MDLEELKQTQQELEQRSAEKHAQSSKVMDLLTAGKRIGCKPVKHVISANGEKLFEFETVAVLREQTRNEFLDKVSNLDTSSAGSVDRLTEACAELMATVCIDQDLKDKEVWLEFNEMSGSLIGIAQKMLQELVISQAELKTFR